MNHFDIHDYAEVIENLDASFESRVRIGTLAENAPGRPPWIRRTTIQAQSLSDSVDVAASISIQWDGPAQTHDENSRLRISVELPLFHIWKPSAKGPYWKRYLRENYLPKAAVALLYGNIVDCVPSRRYACLQLINEGHEELLEGQHIEEITECPDLYAAMVERWRSHLETSSDLDHASCAQEMAERAAARRSVVDAKLQKRSAASRPESGNPELSIRLRATFLAIKVAVYKCRGIPEKSEVLEVFRGFNIDYEKWQRKKMPTIRNLNDSRNATTVPSLGDFHKNLKQLGFDWLPSRLTESSKKKYRL